MIEKPEVLFNQVRLVVAFEGLQPRWALRKPSWVLQAKPRVFEPVLFNQLTYDF